MKPQSKDVKVPPSLRVEGPVTGYESYYSKGHAGEYLLTLGESMHPGRLSDLMKQHQADRFLGGLQAFLRDNPDFALIEGKAKTNATIRQTAGYANLWLWRKADLPAPVQ